VIAAINSRDDSFDRRWLEASIALRRHRLGRS
jgi:hypothetical protein